MPDQQDGAKGLDVPAELRRLAIAVEKLTGHRDPEAQVMAQLAVIEKLEALADHLEINA